MKSQIIYLIPECYVDTNLMETLVGIEGCNHQKGCNQVAKVMQEKFADRFAVGIIDNDKRKPSYFLKNFTEISSSEHLKIYKHYTIPHFIILINPAIDKFILDNSRFAQISVEDYNLPFKLKEFKDQTKNVMSNKDQRFKNLFRALANTGEIKLLKDLLSYLVSNQYHASTDGIVSIFEKMTSNNSK